jgi:hypothetical protein
LEEISVGDYVLSGGEIAALALLDACVRLLPGVMGKEASGAEESFAGGLLEYPQYTRPAVFEGQAIPEVLTGGDHAKVRAWRRAAAERLTRERRPDLWAAYRQCPTSRCGKAGPHEGRELELMKSGTKPLSMFVVPACDDVQAFPEEEFDRLVQQHRLTKRVSVESSPAPDGSIVELRRVFYALPGEQWRIDAMLAVQSIYLSERQGWKPDLERLIGFLLGYEPADIENFIDSVALR